MRWLNSLRADMVRLLAAGWWVASRMSWSQKLFISAAGGGHAWFARVQTNKREQWQQKSSRGWRGAGAENEAGMRRGMVAKDVHLTYKGKHGRNT